MQKDAVCGMSWEGECKRAMKQCVDGEERRKQLLDILARAKEPVSGTELAGQLKVSRQVIVQDIALLRATDKNILSTNKGYVLYHAGAERRAKRTIKVYHTDEQIQDELYTIVDEGGHVLDVVVEHDIYGQITVDLIVNNRADVNAFIAKVRENHTKSLNELTNGVHFHTVEAENEEILDRIEAALDKKGYLLK